MQIHTNKGLREISVEQLQSLVQEGKASLNQKAITFDEGVTFIAIRDALTQNGHHRPADKPNTRTAADQKDDSREPTFFRQHLGAWRTVALILIGFGLCSATVLGAIALLRPRPVPLAPAEPPASTTVQVPVSLPTETQTTATDNLIFHSSTKSNPSPLVSDAERPSNQQKSAHHEEGAGVVPPAPVDPPKPKRPIRPELLTAGYTRSDKLLLTDRLFGSWMQVYTWADNSPVPPTLMCQVGLDGITLSSGERLTFAGVFRKPDIGRVIMCFNETDDVWSLLEIAKGFGEPRFNYRVAHANEPINDAAQFMIRVDL